MKRLRIVAAVIAGIIVLYLVATSDNPPLALTILLAIAAFAWLTYRASKIKLPEAPKKQLPPLSGNFGSADFAPPITALTNPSGNRSGVFFGKSSYPDAPNFPLDSDPGAPVCSAPEKHTLIVAMTGAGKGTRVIIPTLLRYTQGSMIVMDPKGTNAAITARARAALGSKVHIINPWGILDNEGTWNKLGLQPATFNPLDILQRDDPNLVGNAMALGATLSPSLPGEKEAYWPEKAAALIAGIALWLTYREGYPQNPADASSPPERKSLRRLSQIVRRPDFKEFLGTIYALSNQSHVFGDSISGICAEFLALPDVTAGGVLGNVGQATGFLIDPRVLDATDQSSFPIEDLVSHRTTIYIIPPDKISVQARWLRLLIAAAIQTLRYKRTDQSTRCMFLIDEFPALGKLDEIGEHIATMREYGVDFTLVVQGVDQLQSIYGSSHTTILSNCFYKWFCNLNDLESAKHLSQMLGKKTVRTVTKTESTGTSSGGFGGAPSTTVSESLTHGETGKDLLSHDQIIKLGRDVAILITPGAAPHYLRPVDYWELPSAFSMYRDLDPPMLWKPPLQYDPNPLRKGSTGYIYTEPPPQPSVPTPESHSPRSLWRQFANWIKGAEKPAAQTSPITFPPYKPPSQAPASDGPAASASPPSGMIDFLRYAPQSVKDHFAKNPLPTETGPAPASNDPAATVPQTPTDNLACNHVMADSRPPVSGAG